MGRTILYEDEEIRVIWSQGKLDIAFVTFGDLVSPVNGDWFFASSPLEKIGISTIGIMAKRGNWYPVKSLFNARDIISAKIEGFDARVVYGGSMGGYAAIKHSRLLNATHVIALCPQWSLDPNECRGVNPGWGRHFTESMRSMGIRRDDVAGNIFIFSDPFDKIDMFHARMIEENAANVNLVPVPIASHQVTAIFAGTDNLKSISDACQRSDVQALRRISRQIRRAHFIWQDRVIYKMIAKLPRLSVRFLTDPRNDRYLKKCWLSSGATLTNVLFQSKTSGTLDYLNSPRFNELPSLLRQQIVAASFCHATGMIMSIATAHNSMLVYDISKDEVVHTKLSLEISEVRVEVDMLDHSARLFVTLGGTRFYLSVDNGGRLRVSRSASEEAIALVFMFAAMKLGGFSISCRGKHLCAESSGKIICDRDAVQGWELFHFQPYHAVEPVENLHQQVCKPFASDPTDHL